ncbi:hypothetical protein KC678_05010 [Candidatus Dojkabacteria bacterium]|uniref:Uncharacterized protein n=1 Tax=Candidatus Dojkabacteria bacterium TaxID=2099670 RepID=A0A955RHQ2_9BACT|nr:hypothetical protein [Candidatus Dojkabacteria bacterium]
METVSENVLQIENNGSPKITTLADLYAMRGDSYEAYDNTTSRQDSFDEKSLIRGDIDAQKRITGGKFIASNVLSPVEGNIVEYSVKPVPSSFVLRRIITKHFPTSTIVDARHTVLHTQRKLASFVDLNFKEGAVTYPVRVKWTDVDGLNVSIRNGKGGKNQERIESKIAASIQSEYES